MYIMCPSTHGALRYVFIHELSRQHRCLWYIYMNVQHSNLLPAANADVHTCTCDRSPLLQFSPIRAAEEAIYIYISRVLSTPCSRPSRCKTKAVFFLDWNLLTEFFVAKRSHILFRKKKNWNVFHFHFSPKKMWRVIINTDNIYICVYMFYLQ